MARALRVGVLVAVVLALVLASGCRSATEVTVTVRTAADLPCSSVASVAIVVADTPEDAESRLASNTLTAKTEPGTCDADGHTIGTLVVTPGNSTGAIVVEARLVGNENAACDPPQYEGCIVARRAFGFVEHASVTLPVSLDISCLDVPCDVVTSCKTGSCVSSNADCSADTGTCTSPAEPSSPAGPGDDAAAGDALADAPPMDAASSDGDGDADADAASDSGLDGGGNCTGTASCGGHYCCYVMQPMFYCDPDGEACSQTGNHYICTSNADCPLSLPTCSPDPVQLGGIAARECVSG